MDSGAVCLVCMDPIQVFAVGKCNHRNICARCNLKQRIFFKDVACLMCKAQLPTMIYTTHPTRSFEAFSEKELVTSAKLGGSSTHESATRSMLEKLLDFVCPLCGPATGTFGDRDALASHVARQHGMHYCPVCLRDRPVYVSEQICFASKTEMTNHMNKGDDKTHMKGHPKCHFCNEHFYGDEQLYEHMKQLHMECPVCRSRGILHQFYRAYRDLRKHWSDNASDHFVCPDAANCEMAVFGNDVEWRQHQLNVHGASLSKQEARRLLNVTGVFEIRLSNDRRAPSNRVGFQTAESENETSPPPSTAATAAAASASVPTALANVVSSLPQPPVSEADARARNAEVMARMREILHEDVFVHFRESAQRFREGQISPQDYFDSFVGIFGETETAILFPKVVSLLPAAEKRGVLFDIYTRFYSTRNAAASAAAVASASSSAASVKKGKDAAKKDGKTAKDSKKDSKTAKSRKCSSCKKEKLPTEFSKNQLKRPVSESKCRACTEEGPEVSQTSSPPAIPAVAAPVVVSSVVFPPLNAGAARVPPPPGFDGPPPGFEQQFPALPVAERAYVVEDTDVSVDAGDTSSHQAAGGKKKKKQQQKMVLLKFG